MRSRARCHAASEAGFRLGVIVTEGGYSLTRRYQLIIPLLDAAEYDSQPEDVLVTRRGWTRGIHPSLEQAILAVKLIQTAFHPLDLAQVLPVVVDDATIAEVDRALQGAFGL